MWIPWAMSVTSVSFALVPVRRFSCQRRAASTTAAGVGRLRFWSNPARGENCFDAHGAAGELVKPLTELVDVICRVGQFLDQRLGDPFQPNDLVAYRQRW